MIRIEFNKFFHTDSLDHYQRKQEQALYISVCSSEETIAFYKAMESRLADFPINN